MTVSPATTGDSESVRALLAQAQLPIDILEGTGTLWKAMEGDRIVAIGGFEFYGDDALLRSVAVDASKRSAGVGTRLVLDLLLVAKERSVKRVWLLTETAEPFFARLGFRRAARTEIVNAKLLASAEFTHVCSTTAVCMVRETASASIDSPQGLGTSPGSH